MRKTTALVLFSFFCLLPAFPVSSQQITIPRINSMPDLPSPYVMRDWTDVAHTYDSLVFDKGLEGQYLPLLFFRDQSVNYPGHPSFGLHTAVGTVYPASGEAINVIPAVVGATLAGIDKSDQFDENWASMVREFFNRRPEENIYLNHPVTSSGHDWWYETMPNIFYMQARYLYPDIAVFDEQLPVMASQWERALRAMGASDTPWTVPYMNYRAWNMSQMEPLDSGVRQPEAAGALAWILYNAYVETGDMIYLRGAEWAMEFLNGWEENPSYELQLPYGVYTAARMNAELHTGYDIEKMVNWCFDRGPLRGWGAISGNWGGYDCHGLIGEANDQGNDYAFMMNGYQQAAALVPMVRYDHRFARAIAKWVLNMASASRLFYSQYLPDTMQDNAEWSQAYDPGSVIGYEALREVKHGHSPFATGDAIDGGWAHTNLMLYGSSHVGYMAGIINTTNMEGILQLDLLATDFYRDDAYPTFLYFNPHDQHHPVDHALPEGVFRVYDVIGKEWVHTNASGHLSLTLPPGDVVMPVIVPHDADISQEGRRTLANGVIIDYDNGQATGALPPRIQSLAVQDSIIVTGSTTDVYCTATSPDGTDIEYLWFIDGDAVEGDSRITFSAPDEEGEHTISCKVLSSNGLSDSLAVVVQVSEKIPVPPAIVSLEAEKRKLRPGETTQIVCVAEDHYDAPLGYEWIADSGTISGEGESVTFIAPAEPGNPQVQCRVTNPDGLCDEAVLRMMVRDYPDDMDRDPVAYYPLRGNTRDYGGNGLDGTAGGGLSYTVDMAGRPDHAAWFNGTSAFVHMPDDERLNFSDAISVAAFIQVDEHLPREQHPISHGSWQSRYKVSVGSNHLRFTLNTSAGITDLDTESPLEEGRWYHMAVVYDGNDMELWIDGKLDAFTAHTGEINQSPHPLAFGQNLPGNNDYNFRGAMAMVHIYDHALTPEMISDELAVSLPGPDTQYRAGMTVYPNPVSGGYLVARTDLPLEGRATYTLFNAFGQPIASGAATAGGGINTLAIQLGPGITNGLYLLRIVTKEQTYVEPIIVSR